MKIRQLAACLLLAGCSGPEAMSGPGESAMPRDVREVTDAIRAFETALRAADFDALSALLDPHVLVLEAGGAERSREEYLASHAKLDAVFLAGVESDESASALKVKDDLAWSTKTSELHIVREGRPAIVDAAETLILRRGSDGWKIVHIHWSSRPRP